MAATSRRRDPCAELQQRELQRRRSRMPGRACMGSLAMQVAGGVAGAMLAAPAHAVTLPEDRAEAMVHVYSGGGVDATGPALLVRKSIADKVSLSAQYYVDQVSNASIDVVTTASPFKETRKAVDLGVDYVSRDTLMTLGISNSREPDYVANSYSVDVAQEVFGGMTTVSLGFTHGDDDVGRKYQGFFDRARHWQYRLGVTQILSPRWITSANFEAVSDDGYLGSPYRAARVFGAAVPERNPRTRSSRAVKFSSLYDIGNGTSVRAGYRYFWDTWAIRAHTLDAALSRHFGEQWLVDATLRYYRQGDALFYSDDAMSETLYVSRNRQLSAFHSVGLGARGTYTLRKEPGRYEVKANAGYEYVQYRFNDFTDLRTGNPYAYDAHILQVYVSATF